MKRHEEVDAKLVSSTLCLKDCHDKLKDLKQTEIVHDYVKAFSSLLLDRKGMSDENKLFNFISRLKPWPSNGLGKQKFQTYLLLLLRLCCLWLQIPTRQGQWGQGQKVSSGKE